MADWHIDLGFDRDANVTPGSTNYSLQWGAVSMSSAGAAAASSLTLLSPGDTIEFFIYDVSSLADGSGSTTSPAPTISSTWLNCLAADKNTTSNAGFNAASMTAASTAVVSSTSNNSPSSIFANGARNFPSWPINSSSGALLSLTVQNPNPTGKAPGSQNPAAFALTFTITVGTQTFSVDPEMIVQP
jgi:hypothetical protein